MRTPIVSRLGGDGAGRSLSRSPVAGHRWDGGRQAAVVTASSARPAAGAPFSPVAARRRVGAAVVISRSRSPAAVGAVGAAIVRFHRPEWIRRAESLADLARSSICHDPLASASRMLLAWLGCEPVR